MKKKEALKFMGHNIQLARIKKGLTQENLAEKCNVSSKYISALERGVTAGSISLVIDICNILDITPNYIFNHSVKTLKINNTVNVLNPEILITYAKLKDENKDFVNKTISHLYNMQKKR